jgi:multiple sugar transport system permease protein
VRREAAWAYLFIAPQMVGLIAFALLPTVAVVALSFTQWDLIRPIQWVGLANYHSQFSDPLFWQALLHTIYFTVVSIPITMLIALAVALALNRKIALRAWYRAAFFMPVVTSTVAVAIVWSWLFNPDFGLINTLLSYIGISGPQWLASLTWAMPSIIIVSVWQSFGYGMVIFLAGLQGIPAHLYEAAQIDGAGRWQQFRHVTLPMLSPTTFFLFVTGVISSFQVFNQIYIMTGGGPADVTRVLVYQIYELAFQLFKFGDASVVTVVLFAIILAVTLIQFRFARWVTYE